VETNQTKLRRWSYQPEFGKKIQHEQTIQHTEEEITVSKKTIHDIGSRRSGKNLGLQYIKHMATKNLQFWETNGTAYFINIDDSWYQLRQITEKGSNAT
jgi:hypothetical protein